MPLYVVAIIIVAMLVVCKIAVRCGLTLDAAIKRFDDDPDWNRYLGKGSIEDLAR